MTDPKPEREDQGEANTPAISDHSTPPPLAEGGNHSKPAPEPPTRSGRGLASLAVLLALGAAGSNGYFWYLWQQEHVQRDSQVEQAIKRAIDQPSQELRSLKAQIEQLTPLRAAIEQLRVESQNLRQQTLGLTGDLQPLKNATELLKGEKDIFKNELKLLRENLDSIKALVQKQTTDFNTQLNVQQKGYQERLAHQNEQIQNLKLSYNAWIEQMETLKLLIAKGGDVNAFPLAEVDYLLRLADSKLKLEQNLTTARLALEVAQQRLQRVNESALVPTQTIIGEAIASLRGVQLPDLSALSHKIVQMEKDIPHLPLLISSATPNVRNAVKPSVTPDLGANADSPWWDRALQAVWDQFRGIVVVRRTGSGAPPLIAMEEEFFLRQNLQLEMESMRIALLRGDAPAFQEANQLVRKWTTTYFDSQDHRVATFLNELRALEAVQFNPYIPDLAGLQQAFSEVLARRQPVRSMTKTTVEPEQPAKAAGEAQSIVPNATVAPEQPAKVTGEAKP